MTRNDQPPPQGHRPLSRRETLRLGGAALAGTVLAACDRSTRPMDTPASQPHAAAGRAASVSPRPIVQRTRGHRGGPITRLVSPSDFGQLIKPFVFLDLFDFNGGSGPPLEHGWHPHSGIATVTVVFDGAVQYAETTGNTGVLPAGGVEWMRAGGGVWHTGTTAARQVRGFQLWVALPPELENAPCASQYLLPAAVPSRGPVRVVLGGYDGLQSPIAAPPMTYLSVTLRDGERWTFTPPTGHDVAWMALLDGAVRVPDAVTAGELAVFARGDQAIDVVAQGDTRLVFGSAAQHPHDLVLGHYSVHTSSSALAAGETEIRRIGQSLRAAGKQSYALRSI